MADQRRDRGKCTTPGGKSAQLRQPPEKMASDSRQRSQVRLKNCQSGRRRWLNGRRCIAAHRCRDSAAIAAVAARTNTRRSALVGRRPTIAPCAGGGGCGQRGGGCPRPDTVRCRTLGRMVKSAKDRSQAAANGANVEVVGLIDAAHAATVVHDPRAGRIDRMGGRRPVDARLHEEAAVLRAAAHRAQRACMLENDGSVETCTGSDCTAPLYP